MNSRPSLDSTEQVFVSINGRRFCVPAHSSVAAAMMAANVVCHSSISGEPRAPLCGMGICMECRATVDGVAHVRTCQVTVREGMSVVTG